jgi:hypothetical protein
MRFVLSHTKPGTSSSALLFKVIDPISCKKVSIHGTIFDFKRLVWLPLACLCDAFHDSAIVHCRNQPQVFPAVGSSSSKFELEAHPNRVGADSVARICSSANVVPMHSPTLFSCDQNFQLQYKTACPPCPDFL